MKHRPQRPIATRAGRTEFLKINAAVGGWRDSYHWVLSLSWPRFALFLFVQGRIAFSPLTDELAFLFSRK